VFLQEFIDNYVVHCDKMITAVVKSKDPPAQLMIGMDRYVHATFNMLPQWARHVVVQLGMPPQTPNILAKPS
jgi:hypothetical protein